MRLEFRYRRIFFLVYRCGGDAIWTDWQAFATDVPWTLSFVDGTKEVFVEIRDTAKTGGKRTALAFSDTIELVGSSLCDFPGDYVVWPDFDIRSFIRCYSL